MVTGLLTECVDAKQNTLENRIRVHMMCDVYSQEMHNGVRHLVEFGA